MKPTAGFVLAVAVAIAAGCGDGSTAPPTTRLAFDRGPLFVLVGDSVEVRARHVDDAGRALGYASVSWQSDAGAVASVASGHTPGRTIVRGVNPGVAWLRATMVGFTDSLHVTVVPVRFTGTFAPFSSSTVTPVTATAPPNISFAPESVRIVVNGGDAWILSRSTTTVTFIPPPVAPAASMIEIWGLRLLGTMPLPPLTASTHPSFTDAGEPANDAYATAPLLSLPAVIGASTVTYGALIPYEDDHDLFTVRSATADSLEFTLDWLGGEEADLDLSLGASCSGTDYCSSYLFGAWSMARPEQGEARLAAGATYGLSVVYYNWSYEIQPLLYRLTVTRRA